MSYFRSYLSETLGLEVIEGKSNSWSQGFQWVNEGKSDSPKWGFVARQPGDALEVDVPLEGAALRDNTLTIGLGFLLSYNHMGVALVECVTGCECHRREFSTWHP